MNKYKYTPFLLVFLLYVQVYSQPNHLTVKDIFTNPEFYPDELDEFQWFDKGNKYSYLKYLPDSGAYAVYEHIVATGEENILVSPNQAHIKDEYLFTIKNYKWSPDNKYILFTGILPARKLKTGGDFYIYDVSKNKVIYSIESEKEQENIDFSPDSKKVGFVRGNNLYVLNINSGKEKQLTFDGSGEILNGVFDWVYEEEFSIINGWTWSPDSKSIAFWHLDQTNVPVYKIAFYDSLYPHDDLTHYPTAGSNNSVVKVGAVNINSGNITWMNLGDDADIYIPRINFTADPVILSIQRLNRLQNKLDLLFADINTGQSKIVLTEMDTAWLDVSDDLFFLKDGKRFIWSSEQSGYNHLYLYNYTGDLINQITRGEWEVDKLLAVDEKNNRLFYSSLERSPLYRDFYSINLDGTGKKLMLEQKGTHEIKISPDFKFFIDEFSTADSLPATSLYKINGEKLEDLIIPDMSFIGGYELSPLRFTKFKTSGGITLNAYIIEPKDFDSTKTYPVLIFNYSGPGSQSVVDRWLGIDYLWHQILAQKGYIIFCLDNRGTGGRGKAFKNIVYKNLGKWEVHDQIEGAKYLASLPFVDKKRIGIWGWSYGGYISALSILKGAGYFKAAISVAPVIHWKFYDTIYTERYMQTPELNPEGYRDSSPLNYTENLKGKLLIIHGTSDDNVHFQNTVAFVSKLEELNKQFDIMFYPNKLHGISGGNTRIHLYNLMTDFILNSL